MRHCERRNEITEHELGKKILFVVIVILVAIQFIQPAHNTSGQVAPADITKTVTVPGKVVDIFKNACYDCHSNNTRYPWYVHIQPMGWMMARHIKNGKTNLNLMSLACIQKENKPIN
jgi:uncharacterized membrane protein